MEPEKSRQGLRQQRLPERSDRRVGYFDFWSSTSPVTSKSDTLVVIVNRNGEDLLGAFLADHILIKYFLDLSGSVPRCRCQPS